MEQGDPLGPQCSCITVPLLPLPRPATCTHSGVDLEDTTQNKLPTANLSPSLVSQERDQSQYKINVFEGQCSEKEGLDEASTRLQ